MSWKPLTDIWEDYQRKLEEASDDGVLDSLETADQIVWPLPLHIGEEEREDVQEFVTERTKEIMDAIYRDKSLNPNLLASYVFRTILAGMLWEKERIGS